tara:strand:+ start:644 stop:868 length:225 start_codon:yes stop_codon:yes gene_type:complete
MKTMVSIDGKRIFRVTDEEASVLYSEGDANYAPKSLWKEKVRDIEKPQKEKPKNNKKSNKMSKAAKRHAKKSNN